jgi:Pyruvate/2-oxoacid:ferredoxin oxidoreductase gamma subunit
MEELNVVIAGAAGQGVQTIGDILAQTAAAQGYAVFNWKEYESRIRGGQNSYSIRISETPRNAPLMEADVLLALNEGAIQKYGPLLKKGGTLLAEKRVKDRRMIPIPFTGIAEEVVGKRIYANAVALGALMAVLGIGQESLNTVLTKIFAHKGEDIIKSNLVAAEKGFLKAVQDCEDMCPWKLPKRPGKYFLMTVNEAIPLASVYAGCRFIAAYPMSPSTGVITYLATHQEEFGVFAEQAEDEIAAVNMAIGASYAGVRAMTATSGGGFALMVEGVSLAGMTETPLVIVLAQRPGPATGLPTRTSQGDLLFAVNAGHGEFPKMVLAPSDPRLLIMSSFLVDYPFANRLYPGSLDALVHVRAWGPAVILSDGDVAFQPRKVQRSGLWEAVEGRVLIYIHKEQMLDDVELRYPARRYVMVDDKLRILTAMKKVWGDRLTTVWPRQGQYALDPQAIATYPSPDLTIERIGHLVNYDLTALVSANEGRLAAFRV